MIGAGPLGTYVAAVKLSELFEAIPFALGATMFPLLCAADSEPEKFNRYLETSYRILILAAITICVVVATAADSLIRVLYGPQFQHSGPLLSLLIWSQVSVFFSAVVTNSIIALKMERFLIVPSIVGAVINIGLNVVLIPRFGALGAVEATVIANSVAWMGVLLLFTTTRPLILKGLRFALPAVAIGFSAAFVGGHLLLPGWTRIAFSLTLLCVGVVMTGLLRWSDVAYAKGFFGHALAVIRGRRA
jgi:O-antigen/teichoic acid export membrane protein